MQIQVWNTGNTNRKPRPVNTNWGNKVGICKLRLRTGNRNSRPGPVNKNLDPRPVNTNSEPGSVNTNWWLGLGTGAVG